MSLALTRPTPRGWCPGALRPMESGDGLIVRLRPRCGAFTTSELHLVAELSARYGNGSIDLTRRANLQLRGLREADLPHLWEALAAAGLLDESAEAESVRNVMVSPLAGLAPDEIADPRPIASRLERLLAGDDRLWELPGKFGFGVDGGGAFTIAGERADIRLRTVQANSPKMALGLDRKDGVDWVGTTGPDDAAVVAVKAALGFLDVRGDQKDRLRDLADPDYDRLRTALAAELTPDPAPCPALPEVTGRNRTLGILSQDGDLSQDGNPFAFAFAAPFGRIEAKHLRTMAEIADETGIPEMRLSPWRTLYAPLPDPASGEALAMAAIDAGFILDESDPLLAIDACPGVSGCRQTHLDTRQAARALAPHIKRLGVCSCHVSGCAKGCARSTPADLVLVGSGQDYGVSRGATAQAAPCAVVPQTQIPRLLRLFETL
ncbi:MAG: precorrin-3B synthase [Methyloligella sp. ZOD6]